MATKIKLDRTGLPIGQYFRGCELTVKCFLAKVLELYPEKPPYDQKQIADGCWRRRMESFRKEEAKVAAKRKKK